MLLSLQTDPRKAENFDDQFRLQPIKNTKVDKNGRYILDNMPADTFANFSFVNPDYRAPTAEPNALEIH